MACLAAAGIQAGCALPSDAQSMLSSLAAPFSSDVLKSQTPAESCVAAARKLERKRQVKPAIAKYEEARRLDPAAPVAQSLALLYNRDGDVERARAEFARAREASPRDVELLTDMGCFAFEHGNYPEAEQLLRSALELKPGHERACVVLGLALGKQNRYEESLDAFTRILSRDENRAAQDAMSNDDDKAGEKLVKPRASNLARLQQDAIRLSKVDSEAKAP
jgi:tetratricopeptide (TPR) repeat protein